MNGPRKSPSAQSPVDVVLVGGPDDFPESARARQVDATDHTIKILPRGGYEHFELEGPSFASESARQRVFRWTMRTRIAE